MEEKKQNEAKLKHDEEMEKRWISAYAKTKNDLNKMAKKKWKESQAEKIRRTEMIGKIKRKQIYIINLIKLSI